ncbi:helix-turn-helix transcriptional regulator [Tamlana sp. 2201CG12-4]|uniref:helix-turn-helix domain-containing protein n=1 Tax=Tamlana sp. 2201CG12-4 TaxID=3112582 RepID=UPI002DBBD0DF|nr:helix-turn-helix transcriptional regulator [Tamlana sp. 2201CG12-4]MEC3905538.1 helix-turn-helix transcriptional regulator [Tamlana sp. 2201CG12-4]
MLTKEQENKILLKLGKRVREIREEKGITQYNLATDSEISKNQVGRIERGEYKVSVISLIKIAKALDYDFRDFFKYL